jgi:hypothetical protein
LLYVQGTLVRRAMDVKGSIDESNVVAKTVEMLSFSERMKSLVVEAQETLPDTFLWLTTADSQRRRIAYARFSPAQLIARSATDTDSRSAPHMLGSMAGKIHTCFLKVHLAIRTFLSHTCCRSTRISQPAVTKTICAPVEPIDHRSLFIFG